MSRSSTPGRSRNMFVLLGRNSMAFLRGSYQDGCVSCARWSLKKGAREAEALITTGVTLPGRLVASIIEAVVTVLIVEPYHRLYSCNFEPTLRHESTTSCPQGVCGANVILGFTYLCFPVVPGFAWLLDICCLFIDKNRLTSIGKGTFIYLY